MVIPTLLPSQNGQQQVNPFQPKPFQPYQPPNQGQNPFQSMNNSITDALKKQATNNNANNPNKPPTQPTDANQLGVDPNAVSPSSSPADNITATPPPMTGDPTLMPPMPSASPGTGMLSAGPDSMMAPTADSMAGGAGMFGDAAGAGIGADMGAIGAGGGLADIGAMFGAGGGEGLGMLAGLIAL